MERIQHNGKHHYKNIVFICIGLFTAIGLSQNSEFFAALSHLGTFGYIGAFITGMLLVTTFTAPTGALMLIVLAQHYTALEIALVAGAGAVLTDYLIFYFVKDDLSRELSGLYKRFGGSHLAHIFHSKYFHWTLPVAGALIIATPLPDEIGVSLLGISKMRSLQFIFTSFCMHSAGLFLIVSASNFIKV